MKISKKDLTWCSNQKLISATQAEDMWQALSKRRKDESEFVGTNVAYYFGALLIIASMTIYVSSAWDRLGGWSIAAIGGVYASLFYISALKLWKQPEHRVPAGLFATVSVCVIPLFLFGIAKALGFWPERISSYHSFYVLIRSNFLLLEVGTILAGLFVLRRIKFPFIIFPVAFALWFMSMDVTDLLFHHFRDASFDYFDRSVVSIWFGLGMLILSFCIDRKTKEDYAFWTYLFGTLTFWGGLTVQFSGSEMSEAFYCLINLLMIFVSVFVRRAVLTIFGTLGVMCYLGHLAYEVFENFMAFSFVLTLIGLMVIYLAVLYQKNQSKVRKIACSLLPPVLCKYLSRFN